MTDLHKITRQKCPMSVEEYEQDASLDDYRELDEMDTGLLEDEIQPDGLEQWLEDVPRKEIDATLEWLKMKDLLNVRGEIFERVFWLYTWHIEDDE